MKVCPTCQRCYEDEDTSCTEGNHEPLAVKRAGTRLIDSRYRLDWLLGRGGLGAVYKCTHISLNRAEALKLLHPGSVEADPHGRQRLQREALTACMFDHPNVVRIYDFGANPVPINEDGSTQTYDELYIVMELLNGETLREYLAKNKPIPFEQAIRIADQIADGLAAVHAKGVVHRDLKPANIMLTHDHHGGLLVKIVDFGAVKLIDDSIDPDDVELTGAMMVGSAPYTSPENCRGLPLDQRSDIYCLGLILYEMLAGRRPFESSDKADLIHKHAEVPAPSLSDVRPDVPELLAQLTMRSLEKNPEARPQSADEFARALQEFERTLKQAPQTNYQTETNAATWAEAPPIPADDGIRNDEETRAAGRSATIVTPYHPEQEDTGGVGRTIFAGLLLLALMLTSFFLIRSFTENTPSVADASNTEEPAATPAADKPTSSAASDCSVGRECVTITDANLRANPGKNNEWVGLAEKGSKVRILAARRNWCEVVVLEHGREKEHPESADQGWLDGDTLQSGN